MHLGIIIITAVLKDYKSFINPLPKWRGPII